MGDTARIRVDNGKQELVLTREQFTQYMSSLTDAGRARVKVLSGNIPSVYENSRGKLVRESISGEQVKRRMAAGEDPTITGATDPKLQAFNQQQAQSAKQETAKEEGLLAFVNAANPWNLTGLPQAAERHVLGDEAAIQGRAEIAQGSPALDLAGSITLGLGAGGLATGVLRGAGKTIGLGMTAAIEDVAFETTHYVSTIMDTNQPFQAEDLARNIVQGMLFTAPIIGAAMLRKPALAMLDAGGSAAQTALTVAAVTAGPGKRSQVFARGAAVAGLSRKLFGKSVKTVDEAAEAAKRAAKEGELLGRTTPAALSGAKGVKRVEMLDNLKSYMDDAADWLDDIDFDGLTPNLNRMRAAVKDSWRQGLTINQRVGDQTLGIGRLGKSAQTEFVIRMDALTAQLGEAGMGDILNYLEPLQKGNGSQAYGSLVQARLDSAIKRGTTGGAAQADDMLREVLVDSKVWGTGKAVKSGKEINQAIDDVVDAMNALDDLNIPKDTRTIRTEGPSPRQIQGINDNINKLRSAYATLERHKMLKRSQVRAIEKNFILAEKAVADGSQAYIDAGKVNKAYESASGNHTRKYEDIRTGKVTNPEDIHASIQHRVMEFAKRREGLLSMARSVIVGEKLPIIANRGVMALQNLTTEEKAALYTDLQHTLPTFTGSPMAMEDSMSPFLGDAMSAPTVSALGGASAGQTIFWLAAQMPRPDRSLYGKDKPPSRQKVEGFLEKYAAAMDPISVAEAALRGRATKGMIDAIRNTSPAMYAELGADLSELLDGADPVKAPRKVINGLSKFIGGADPLYGGAALMQLQSHYAQNPQQQQEINGPQMQGKFQSPGVQSSDNDFTFTQRIQSY